LDNSSVRGGGSDLVGDFVLDGTKNGGLIKFTKLYEGQHALEYEGKLFDLEDGSQKIVGMWSCADQKGDFELLRDLQLERKREAAFNMIVARMKMNVGLLRFFCEDLGLSCIQIFYLMEHKTTPWQFYFTVASVSSGILLSILGPLVEAVNARNCRLAAGEAAEQPPSVDGGAFMCCTGMAHRSEFQTTSKAAVKGLGMGEHELLLSKRRATYRLELEAQEAAYKARIEQAREQSNGELLSGNTDYIEVLMEKPDEPALVPDISIADVVASNKGVRQILSFGVLLYWSYIICVPFVFDLSCEHAIPAESHVIFLCIASFNMFLQIWCAALTKYGYLTLVHAPQKFGASLFLTLLGLFGSYSDIAFIGMIRQCGSPLWIPAGCIYFVGVILAQALPGILMLVLGYKIPAALKLNEMNVLIMLLKPSGS
ncbi:unnamed protein product, partial [Polarella glacialis]